MSADAGVQAQFDRYESEQRERYGVSEIESRKREIESLQRRIDEDMRYIKEQKRIIQNQEDVIMHLKENLKKSQETNKKLLKVVEQPKDIFDLDFKEG